MDNPLKLTFLFATFFSAYFLFALPGDSHAETFQFTIDEAESTLEAVEFTYLTDGYGTVHTPQAPGMNKTNYRGTVSVDLSAPSSLQSGTVQLLGSNAVAINSGNAIPNQPNTSTATIVPEPANYGFSTRNTNYPTFQGDVAFRNFDLGLYHSTALPLDANGTFQTSNLNLKFNSGVYDVAKPGASPSEIGRFDYSLDRTYGGPKGASSVPVDFSRGAFYEDKGGVVIRIPVYTRISLANNFVSFRLRGVIVAKSGISYREITGMGMKAYLATKSGGAEPSAVLLVNPCDPVIARRVTVPLTRQPELALSSVPGICSGAGLSGNAYMTQLSNKSLAMFNIIRCDAVAPATGPDFLVHTSSLFSAKRIQWTLGKPTLTRSCP